MYWFIEKVFFWHAYEKKEEPYEKIIKVGRNNDCKTDNLLDYEYFWNHFKPITIDLSKQFWVRKPWFKTTNYFYW